VVCRSLHCSREFCSFRKIERAGSGTAAAPGKKNTRKNKLKKEEKYINF
jgi:hypothetical protein